MKQSQKKITTMTRIGYGAGGFIGGGGLTFAHSWLLFYYTAFCNIEAWQGALIFSIATWLDIIESSVIGFISDNFYSTALGRKFGRRRFFILITIPLFLLYPLCWIRNMPYFYYLFTYLIYDFVDNTFAVTHATLKTEMSTDYTQRQLLSGAGSIGSKIAGFATAGFPLIFFLWMGKNNPNAYLVMTGVYSIIMVIAGTMVYLNSWEYSPEEVHIEQVENFWSGVKKMIIDTLSTFRIKTFRWHIGMYITGSGGLWLFSSISTFFMIYVMHKSTIFASGLSTIMKPFALLTTIFAIWLVTKVGDTAKPYIGAFVIVISAMLLWSAVWFFGLTKYSAIVAIGQCLLSLGEGIAYYVPQANYPYMPDIDELVTDRRREGVISGAQTMAGKLMRGTVTFVSGTVLSMMGFVKGKPSQPYSVQFGIVLMMLIGTCGLSLIAIWCSRHMKADKKNLAIVDKEVKRIHNGGDPETVDPNTKHICEMLSGFKYEHCFGKNNVGYKDESTLHHNLA